MLYILYVHMDETQEVQYILYVHMDETQEVQYILYVHMDKCSHMYWGKIMCDIKWCQNE